MKKSLRAVGGRLLAVAKNPVLKPVEIWALRAAFAALATYLGLDVKHVL